MCSEEADVTISESKEESLHKALELIGKNQTDLPPLSRPDLSTKKIISAFFIWLLACAFVTFIIVFAGNYFNISLWIVWAAALIFWALVLAFKTKSFIRCAVLLYQKHAPEKIRRACVFTPSCSEYMLLAIEKYGVIKGCFKGIRRLCRCHYPNGGEDHP